MKERTLLLVKPDGVKRKLIGEVISRFEKKGFDIIALRVLTLDEETINKHYEEHLQRDFFQPLKKFMMSGPIVAAVIEGESAISETRKINGATNPLKAAAGTIRGDYGIFTRYNIVHGSDSAESAERELKIFFPEI
jgi:nucleoside-diphosphate kinase